MGKTPPQKREKTHMLNKGNGDETDEDPSIKFRTQSKLLMHTTPRKHWIPPPHNAEPSGKDGGSECHN